MKKNPFIAGLISLIVPGLGHIYSGETNKGAIILIGAIIIANLNVIILPLLLIANPELSLIRNNVTNIWAYWIPRVVHDIVSLWSIIFWIWVIFDAFYITRKIKRCN
ncbi:MAG: hypothetical protein JXB17_09595 [Bacteroidales bacterium]|nr:hypothetical protein [Bacteroidales bacterium]